MRVLAPSSAAGAAADAPRRDRRSSTSGPVVIRYPQGPAATGHRARGRRRAVGPRGRAEGDGTGASSPIGKMVEAAEKAAEELAADGIDVTVWDVRCCAPLDAEMIADARRATGSSSRSRTASATAASACRSPTRSCTSAHRHRGPTSRCSACRRSSSRTAEADSDPGPARARRRRHRGARPCAACSTDAAADGGPTTWPASWPSPSTSPTSPTRNAPPLRAAGLHRRPQGRPHAR